MNFFTVVLPDADALSLVTHRLSRAGRTVQEIEAGLLVRDPSQNGVVLTTAHVMDEG